MLDISLRKIEESNFHKVIKLEVHENQKGFVATNVYSIAQSTVIDQAECVAIYEKEEPVGFVLFDFWKDQWWISRFMIAKEHQGKGMGKAAMVKLITYMKDKYRPKDIFLSIVPENTAAQKLYEKVGFVDTGEMEEGEKVFKLSC